MPTAPDPGSRRREPRGNALRLFFALWPGEPERGAIAELAGRIRHHGKPVRVENLHITLAFLGSVAAEFMPCVMLAGEQLRGRAFTLELDTLGYWKKPRLLWLGSAHLPDVLHALVVDLNTALEDCGFTPESRPYHAHVTLARKVNRAPAHMDVDPVRWRVDRLCLLSSETHPGGSNYTILKCWPLSGAGQDRLD